MDNLDYVYIPLGGNRKGNIRHSVNLISVMSLFGLWHGASWMFLLWGTSHGILLVLENQLILENYRSFKYKDKSTVFFLNFLKIILVFYVVSLNWIFFRVESFDKSLIFVKSFINCFQWKYNLITNKTLFVYVFIFILFGILVHIKKSFIKTKIHNIFYSIAAAIMFFYILTSWNSNNAFIYFQF